LLSFGRSVENYRSSANSLAPFLHNDRYVVILAKKLGRATFWATFSPTHLVTLPESATLTCHFDFGELQCRREHVAGEFPDRRSEPVSKLVQKNLFFATDKKEFFCASFLHSAKTRTTTTTTAAAAATASGKKFSLRVFDLVSFHLSKKSCGGRRFRSERKKRILWKSEFFGL
jgi:hypothetical protein